MSAARVRLAPALAFLFASPTVAQTVKLNGPLLQPGSGDVLEDYSFSPSGARMVFHADLEDDGVFELYSAPFDASAPALRLVPGVHVESFLAGVGRAVFRADPVSGAFELFQVPLAGGAPSALSGGLVAGGDVISVQLTPNRLRAVFLADKVVDGRFELFSVPIDGSAAPIRLDPANVPGPGTIRNSWITPDSATVLFSHHLTAGITEKLFAVPIDGSTPPLQLAVAPATVGEGVVSEVRITADGAYAVFRTEELIDGDPFASHLKSVPVDGSDVAQALDDAGFYTQQFAIAAGGRVVFRVGDAELSSCLLDGTQRVRLDPEGGSPSSFGLAPDGATVVFSAYTGLQSSLYSAPVNGAQPATLLIGPGSLGIDSILFTGPQRIVFRIGNMLQSLDLGGGPPVVLSGPPGANVSPLTPLGVLPGGQEVVFRGFRTTGVFELFGTPVDGSASPRRISAEMTGSKDVWSFAISAFGQVAYIADQTNESTMELFAAHVDAPPVPYVEVPGGPIIGDVIAFRVASDEKGLVYHADEYEDENSSLFDVPVNGSGTREMLLSSNHAQPGFVLSPTGDYAVFEGVADYLFSSRRTGDPAAVTLDSILGTQYEVSPDGERVVYLRGPTAQEELRSVPIDGQAPWVRLSTFTGFTNRTVNAFQVAPDSARVVYRADQDLNEVFELYSVPIDGSASAVKLNAALSDTRDVDAFRISPDGSLVVYVADQELNNLQELYGVPIDGSAAPRKLNGTLIAAGDVTEFAFSPDGGRVVYRADAVADGRHELFSVDLLAPDPPTAIPLTTLAGMQAVQLDFRIDPAGAQVLFRADASTPGVVELFRVPIDGSAAAAQLSAALVAGGSVASFALAPDGGRVVYLADMTADEVFELFGVLSSGGPVTAIDPLPAFADVDVYRIAPDSASVVYRADRNADGVQELFGAPLDGSAAAVLLNDPLPWGGAVQSDFAALSSGRAIYRADQEEAGVFELFFARMETGGNGKPFSAPRGPLPQAPPRGL